MTVRGSIEDQIQDRKRPLTLRIPLLQNGDSSKPNELCSPKTEVLLFALLTSQGTNFTGANGGEGVWVMGRRPLLVRGLSVLCAALISTSSWAATTTVTVNPSKGSVLINRGNGYTEIKRPTKVRDGTNVMAGPDGAAIIAYSDGCSVKVAPGSVETVAPLSPCASGSTAQSRDYSQDRGQCFYWWSLDRQQCIFWPLFAGMVAFITYEAISP
jgi:hypothetical protein